MFSNALYSIAAFLVALGVLISIHEFGHFWVARKMGVKVLKFSIGFGKPIWSRKGKVDDTEYVLASIPLGGYVKMLDEREGNVHPDEVDRAFNRKSVWARIAVVIAGPVANFLLAIAVYWIVMMTGISGIAPLLGEIDEGSPAGNAGFQFEDRIDSIGDKRTPTWSDARIALLDQAMSGDGAIEFNVTTVSGESVTRELQVDGSKILKSDGDVVRNLGISQWWPKVPAVIGGLQPDGAATAAGLLIGDQVIAVDGAAIETWRDWVLLIRANPEKELQITVERESTGTVDLQLTPKAKEAQGSTIGFIGAWETLSSEQAGKARVVVKYPPLEAFTNGLARTWEMSVLTLRMLQKLLIGEAAIENISGPISIAQFAGQSASIGLDHYLNFIALISISLAVLNLLPIPMLDGGHLLFYLYEIIFRKPLPERAQLIGQQFGIVVLGCLMFVAFYNDIWRLLQ